MNQLNFFDAKESPQTIINQDGECLYYPNFFDQKESNSYLNKLYHKIEWSQEEMFIYGKQVKFPRLSAWYGEKEKTYSFSGKTYTPLVWNESLLAIKYKVEEFCNTSFNSVLLNLYRNGADSMGWHADNEQELGRNPTIASVNFGAARKFQLKHLMSKEKIEVVSEHGSLLIMKGKLQHYWQHQIPKTKLKVSERINLTFRKVC